jgi:hypothetical protein
MSSGQMDNADFPVSHARETLDTETEIYKGRQNKKSNGSLLYSLVVVSYK